MHTIKVFRIFGQSYIIKYERARRVADLNNGMSQ